MSCPRFCLVSLLSFFACHGILYECKEMSSWVNRLHLFFMWDCMTSSLPPLRTCIEETNVPHGLRLLSHSFFLLTPSSPPVHSNATTYNNPWMRIPFPGRLPPSSFFSHHSPFSPVYVVIPCLSFLGSAPGKCGSAPVFSPVVFNTILLLSLYNMYYLLCMAQLRAFNSFSRTQYVGPYTSTSMVFYFCLCLLFFSLTACFSSLLDWYHLCHGG